MDTAAGFLQDPEPTPEIRELFADDEQDMGFVMNASKAWAHQPAAMNALFDLLGLR